MGGLGGVGELVEMWWGGGITLQERGILGVVWVLKHGRYVVCVVRVVCVLWMSWCEGRQIILYWGSRVSGG